jgi:hypothetical protein
VKVLGFAGQAGVARNISPAQAAPIGIEPAAPKRWFIRSSGEYTLVNDFCYRVKRKIDYPPEGNDRSSFSGVATTRWIRVSWNISVRNPCDALGERTISLNEFLDGFPGGFERNEQSDRQEVAVHCGDPFP